MDWFRHDSNANLDDKLQKILLDYGLEGYGLYWYCIELIVGKVSQDNITFELKHDAKVIARNTGSTPQKVEEMMRRFVELGLFEIANGTITCLKVAKRLMTSATSNPQMRSMIQNIKINQNVVEPSRHRHDEVMPDKIRIDKIREDKNKYIPPIPAELLKEWMRIRGSRKPVTERVFNHLINEANKLGWTTTQAVEYACMKTWQGFESSWVEKEKPVYQNSREAAARTAFGSLIKPMQIEKVVNDN